MLRAGGGVAKVGLRGHVVGLNTHEDDSRKPHDPLSGAVSGAKVTAFVEMLIVAERQKGSPEKGWTGHHS
jgi:hypothetical protein